MGRRFVLSFSQPPSAPRRREPPLWPALVTGGAGIAAIAVLAVFGGAERSLSVAVLLSFAVVVAVAIVRGERSPPGRPAEPAKAATAAAVLDAELVEALPDPILVVSAGEGEAASRRRYVLANAAAREAFRLGAADGPLVAAIRDPAVLEAADRALAGEAAEATFSTGGVQPREFRVQARPMGEDAQGARLGLLAFRDETEARRVEQTRVDFLANASHELRTPLASLSGFIETLRGHAREDAGAREKFLAIMQAQAERMNRLIDDLLSLSRIELNEHIAPSETVDLAGAAADVADALAPLARERGVKIELKAPKGGALVLGDRDQIVQVVQNLADNALKYSSLGGVVTIEVAAKTSPLAGGGAGGRFLLVSPDAGGEGYAAVRVSDEGPGIAREHLPRLTERFYRVEGQKSGERLGTGLGLAIVKHIVNRHRGGLAVESAPGEGAVFTAYFPQAAPATVAKLS